MIQSGIDEGASVPLDGRNITVPGYEKGNFVGPTVISNVTPSMECYKEVGLGGGSVVRGSIVVGGSVVEGG